MTKIKSLLGAAAIFVAMNVSAQDDRPRIFFSADPKATDCTIARKNSETHFEKKGGEVVVRCFVSGTIQDKEFKIAIETHGADRRIEVPKYNGSCLYEDITFSRRGKFHVRLLTDGRDPDISKDIFIE